MQKEAITKIIKKLGIASSLKGYYYIREGIELIAGDLSYVGALTKRLYPDIAKKFETTASKVERAIRHSIESGWLRADEEFAKELFGYSTDALRGNPTNGEFLATIADYVALREGADGE